jgi:hypothetical protein
MSGMFLKSFFVSVALALVAFTACSESDQQTASNNLVAEDGAVDGPAASGGSTGTGGASSGGGSTASGGTTRSGGTSSTGSDAGPVMDATPNDASNDSSGNTPEVGPPICLGADEPCGIDGGTCCEAYVCRSGRCCVPNGIRSWCTSSSDCCSRSCVLNQCTCVPRGYSCSGPGQCCSGYACVNGTCICPPDIRGC